MASVGKSIDLNNPKPIIGIADSSSELNPCNLPLARFIPEIKKGIEDAGGIAVTFPVTSLGEDLMKPSAMLYRNLLSIEIEENLRSYPLDGSVLLANCDKSVPGALMGALSADLPTIMFTAGARPIAEYKGSRIGTGTELWKMWESKRANRISNEEWQEFEKCLSCGLGSCNTMGTASSVSMMVETLGLMLPGTSTIAESDPRKFEAAYNSGKQIVEMVNSNLKPSSILSPSSFRNAMRILHASGGSSNAIIHLLALSGRIMGEFRLEDINLLAEGISVLADVQPSGIGRIQDFEEAGGVPALISQITEVFELEALTCFGSKWSENLREINPNNQTIRPLNNPVHPGAAFSVVKGSLAPKGALIKKSAASERLLKHSGPAIVFNNYEEMLDKIDDPELKINKDHILILRGSGPVGVPGMPEWGMIPIPKYLLDEGVEDMVRISDARMSGTSFGTCILHVSPESSIGGPLSLVRNGDIVELDVSSGLLNLLVPEDELEARAKVVPDFNSDHQRGWPYLYQKHVLQADLGCDLDFMRPTTKEMMKFIPPIIGRS
jgi:dihydroxy-acid dehydratase